MLILSRHRSLPGRRRIARPELWTAWSRRIRGHRRIGARRWHRLAMVLLRQRSHKLLQTMLDARRFTRVFHHHGGGLQLTLRALHHRLMPPKGAAAAASGFTPAQSAVSLLRTLLRSRDHSVTQQSLHTTRTVISATYRRQRSVAQRLHVGPYGPSRRSERGLARRPARSPSAASAAHHDAATVAAPGPWPSLGVLVHRLDRPRPYPQQPRRIETPVAPAARLLRRARAPDVQALVPAAQIPPAVPHPLRYDAAAERMHRGRAEPRADVDVRQLTSEVMREIDRRFIAGRERMGRI